MRLDSVLCEYEMFSFVVYKICIQGYLFSGVSGVDSTECCHLHSKMNVQVLCSIFFSHILTGCYCCSTADRHQSRCMREWNNGAAGTALVPEVLVRIKGMMYSLSWFTKVTFVYAFIH